MRERRFRFLLTLPLVLIASAASADIHLLTFEVISKTGDGMGNMLGETSGIAAGETSGVQVVFGTIYVTGFDTNNAFKITRTTKDEIIDSSGDGVNPLDGPRSITVDRAGTVFLAGSLSNNVFRISLDGSIVEIIDANGDDTGNNMLQRPTGVAVDEMGNVYVTGLESNNAFKILPDGTKVEIINASGDGTNPLNGPRCIAVKGGNVFVAGEDSDNVFKIEDANEIRHGSGNNRLADTSVTITEIIDGTGDGGGNVLDGSWGVAVDDSGNVYVSGKKSNNAFKITPGGVITEIIDDTGGAGEPLDGPGPIAVDGSGNVYVSAELSNNAFRITSVGVITEIIDEEGAGGEKPLAAPDGIAVDGAGNVYVAGAESNNAFSIIPLVKLFCDGFESGDTSAWSVTTP